MVADARLARGLKQPERRGAPSLDSGPLARGLFSRGSGGGRPSPCYDFLSLAAVVRGWSSRAVAYTQDQKARAIGMVGL